ncbi:hypothetical protein ACWDTD_05390 [Gordonia sp. NPDC003425]
MEPVEINAGSWYLRGLRADDRLSDAAALAELGVDDPVRYVAGADAGWRDETTFTWAVCVPTTGELIALIGLTPAADAAKSGVAQSGTAEPGAAQSGTAQSGTAVLSGCCRAGGADAMTAAVAPVSRFAAGALGLSVTGALIDAIPPVIV